MDTSLIQHYNVDKETFCFEKSWSGEPVCSNTVYINHNGLSLSGNNWGVDGITLENIYLFNNQLCIGLNSGLLSLPTISFEKQNNNSLYFVLNESGKDGDIYFPTSIINGITGGNSASFYALISNTKLAEKNKELVSGSFIIKLESTNNIVFQNITPSYNLTSLKLSPLSVVLSLTNVNIKEYENGANIKIDVIIVSGNMKLYKRDISDFTRLSQTMMSPIYIKSLYRDNDLLIKKNIYVKNNKNFFYDQSNLFFNETYEYSIVLKNIITGEETIDTKSILTIPCCPKKILIENGLNLSLNLENYLFLNETNISYIIQINSYNVSGKNSLDDLYTIDVSPEIISTNNKNYIFDNLYPFNSYN